MENLLSKNKREYLTRLILTLVNFKKYQEAIDKVPQSFKKSSIRTYRSAPYFNTLEEMNANLEEDIQENTKQIIAYKTNPSLNLYTIKNVATNLWLFPDVATVRNMLIKASEADIKATLTENKEKEAKTSSGVLSSLFFRFRNVARRLEQY